MSRIAALSLVRIRLSRGVPCAVTGLALAGCGLLDRSQPTEVAVAEPVLEIVPRPVPLEIRLQCDPLPPAAPSELLGVFEAELAAAFTATQQFVVVPPGAPGPGPIGAPVVEAGAGPGPEMVLMVRVREISPYRPQWIRAELELFDPRGTRPAVRLQGTWQAPDATHPGAPTRRGRWRAVQEPAENFDEQAVLIASSPRHFARYAAVQMAEGMTRRWMELGGPSAQTMESLTTGSDWSAPPEFPMTP